MTVPTPENVRHHAAGHLAAAIILVEAGHANVARIVLNHVVAYANHPQVDAPPQLLAKLSGVAANPENGEVDLRLLEEWFCNPLNTIIENSTRAGYPA